MFESQNGQCISQLWVLVIASGGAAEQTQPCRAEEYAAFAIDGHDTL